MAQLAAPKSTATPLRGKEEEAWHRGVELSGILREKEEERAPGGREGLHRAEG